MPLKDLIATDRDKIAARDARIAALRELLRDVYDVAKNGEPITEGLLSRIRSQMAAGR